MRRREFITLLSGAAAAWPLAAKAQQAAMPVVGFVAGGSADEYNPMTAAFQRGLNDRGYVVDRTVAIEYRWAEGRYDRFPAPGRKFRCISRGVYRGSEGKVQTEHRRSKARRN